MTEPSREWVSRAEVESWWRAVISGEVSREAAHAWAVPIVETNDFEFETMAMGGSQWVHGLGMTRDPTGNPSVTWHGMAPGREYVRSDAEVAEALDYWLDSCARYDRDPVEFARQRGIAAVKMLQAERPDRARPYANTLVRDGVLTAEEAEAALGSDEGRSEGLPP